MPTPRQTRRIVLAVLYQLDARGGDEAVDPVLLADPEVLVETDIVSEKTLESLTPDAMKKAVLRAIEAFGDRASADATAARLAPDWPPHRQAAVDRAIFRLAHHEITSGQTPIEIAVNEAVELAKSFSTEKSPAFINGLLGSLAREIGDQQTAPDRAPDHAETTED